MLRPSATSAGLVAAFLFSGLPAAGAPPEPPPAKSPIAAPAQAPSAPDALAVYSKARAAAGSRGVFLAFHASWCVWCRALEKLTLAPSTKPVFDRHYEVVWLTVDERPSKKSLENPGADELRSRIGGDGVALPFYAVVDPKGAVVATSVRWGLDGKKENIGFPGTPDEVGAFLDLFRAGAPGLTEAEEKALVAAIGALARR